MWTLPRSVLLWITHIEYLPCSSSIFALHYVSVTLTLLQLPRTLLVAIFQIFNIYFSNFFYISKNVFIHLHWNLILCEANQINKCKFLDSLPFITLSSNCFSLCILLSLLQRSDKIYMYNSTVSGVRGAHRISNPLSIYWISNHCWFV